jgi:hypothetical protein
LLLLARDSTASSTHPGSCASLGGPGVRVCGGAQDAFEDFFGIRAPAVGWRLEEPVIARPTASREFLCGVVVHDTEGRSHTFLEPTHDEPVVDLETTR